VYLNGSNAPELSGPAPPAQAASAIFIGGAEGGAANFEGRIDEIAVFGRVMGAAEAARHFELAGVRR
jgi:hypothetical protein